MTEDDRQTYRVQIPVGVAVCYQRQVRDEMGAREDARDLFPRPSGKLSPKRAEVREIDREMAWKVISRYEWLGTLPSFANRFFGIFFSDFCGGVACYGVGSVGAGNAVARRYDLEQTEIAYLARGACVHWAPKGTAPRLINFSAKLLGREGCQLAIAYADTDAGEIGTVYQASGWDCLGFGVQNIEWVSPSGRVYNVTLTRDVIRKNGGRLTRAEASQALKDGGWTVQKGNPKLRYASRIGPGLTSPDLGAIFDRDRIPYPKRGEVR